MKKSILFLIVGFLAPITVFSQTWIWDTIISNLKGGALSLIKDPANNVYTYNPLAYAGPQTVTPVSKVNAQGQLLWQLNFPANMEIKHIVTSPDSTVYMGGGFAGTISVGGNTFVSQGNSDIWLVKYSYSGSLLWCKTISSKAYDGLGEICMSGKDLILTGSISDTVNFLGSIIPKSTNQDFFLARVSAGGNFQSIKFAGVAGTPTAMPLSYGDECEVDLFGNIYVLASFLGRSKIDTFHIGTDVQHQQYLTKAMIKFNSQMQVQYVKQFGSCFMICTDNYYDLNINAAGDLYFVQSYSYGQSGSDSYYAWINRLTPNGQLTATYQPRPDRKSFIGDIDIDKCGNVYFTGICRGNVNSMINYYTFMNGQLSPSLKENWRRLDSSATNYAYGTGLAILSPNNLFVSGVFTDSVMLANTLIQPNNSQDFSGFLTGLQRSSQSPCDIPNTVGLDNQYNDVAFSPYPNPCTDVLHIGKQEKNTEVTIYSTAGTLLSGYLLGEGMSTLNVDNIPAGLYLIQIKNGETMKRGKFLVQR